jgi:REP element-mobilizing transposase RayT
MSTYLSLHFHIVFSTKNRLPFIKSQWRERLHAYLGGTIRGLEGIPEEIGGVEDHVHLLIGLKATHCLADVMRDLKKSASAWVHEEIGLTDFAWQEGYSAFTVSPTAREQVRGYIKHQEEHHRRKTYREELIEFLNAANIPFDPQYLD